MLKLLRQTRKFSTTQHFLRPTAIMPVVESKYDPKDMVSQSRKSLTAPLLIYLQVFRHLGPTGNMVPDVNLVGNHD